jgi:hypothetical protein
MTTRWHILLLLTLLLVSSLPARAACTFQPLPSVGAGTCSTTACTTSTYLYLRFFKPAFVVKCDSDREYFILRVFVEPQQLSQFFNAGIVYTGTPTSSVLLADLNSYFAKSGILQSVNMYIWDGSMDFVPSGVGDFKDTSGISEFTIYGAKEYEFTFNNSIITSFEIQTSQLPNCKAFFGEKILKANDSTSALYQCGLFVETVGNPPHSGLGGCIPHRCQYYADKKIVTFCDLRYNDDDCYFKAEHVWMIGTEYDLSSLPKIFIFLAYLILFFHGLATGLRVS